MCAHKRARTEKKSPSLQRWAWRALSEVPLEEFLQHLYVQGIRAKMESCRVAAAILMKSMQSAGLTVYEQKAAYRHWEAVTRDGDTLEFMLELIRRHQREQLGTRLPISS
jgi:hypothetical protein